MKYRIILFLGFFFSKNIQSQSVQSIDNFLQKYREQKAFDQKTMNICDSLLASKSLDNVAISIVFTLKGHILKLSNQDNEAFFFYKKALLLREKHFKKGSELTASAYRNLAKQYLEAEDISNAKAFFQKSNDMIVTHCGEGSEEQIEPLKGLVNITKAEGNNQKAIILLEKIDLLQEKYFYTKEKKKDIWIALLNYYVHDANKNEQTKKLIDSLSNIAAANAEYLYYKGIFQIENNQYNNAILTLHKAQSLTEEQDLLFYKICFQKAMAYRFMNQTENAIAALDDAIHFMPPNEIGDIGKIYHLQADIFKDNKEYKRALLLYRKALQTLKNSDAIICNLSKIEILIDSKQITNALHLLKKQGFQENKEIFFQTNFLLAKAFFQKKEYQKVLFHYEKINTSFADFWQRNEKNYEFVQIKNGIAAVWAAQKNWSKTEQYCNAAFDKMSKMNQTASNEKDQFLLEQELFATFDLAIQACLAQGNSEKAFGWSERSKNHLLKKYNSNQSDVANVKDIQNALKIDETLLSYHVGNANISIFIIKKDEFEIEQVAISEHFQDTIIQFFNLCSHPPKSNKEQEVFTNIGFQLYQSLWAKVKSHLTKNVIIVPDSYLCYVPFEALLSQSVPKENIDRMRDFPFLIQQYNIRYSNSASLLPYFQAQPLPKNNGKLLAFAPSFEGEKHLVFNQEEVRKISSFFDTKMNLGKSATLSEFIADSTYQILHLSTHAKSDNENSDFSFIAFSRDSLTKEPNWDIANIYQQHLKAELVVLSACETAIGQHYRGEGLFSISRAFQMAGARSVVASLWNVNDEQTPKLMETFYRQLQQQRPKSEALCIAKKTYLKDVSHSLAHPFYWTGFLLIGDDTPIQQSLATRCWLSIKSNATLSCLI